MSRLPRHLVLLVPLAFLAACTAPAAALTTPSPTSPALPASPVPTAPPTIVPSEATGGTAAEQPEVSVEPLGGDRYRVTIADATAKAWRLTIRGATPASADAFLRVRVDTGDLAYSVDVISRTSATETSRTHLRRANAAEICEPTTGACLAADGVRTPGNPSSHAAAFVVSLDPASAVAISGATATWAGEPFVLGAWHESEALTIGG